METERRSMITTEVRTKESEENEMVIGGYALKYNTWSQNLGGFIETIDKQALRSADLSDVNCMIDHDRKLILAKTTKGTLNLEIDDVGLRFDCVLPNTTYAKDLYENIRVGNYSQCSFGFELEKNGDEIRFDKEQSLYRRTLKSFKRIFDVTITDSPAYKDTDVSPVLRSIEHLEKEQQNRLEAEKLKIEMDLIEASL